MKQQLLASLLSILFLFASTTSLAVAAMNMEFDGVSDPIVAESMTPCHETLDSPAVSESERCCGYDCLAHCVSASVILNSFPEYLTPFGRSVFDHRLDVQAAHFIPDNFYRPPIIR